MPPEAPKPSITPETKVGALLRDFPELEDVLIDVSPAYRALKNPILRRTVAKVANLRQVAKVGGVPLGALITRLRTTVGQSPLPDEAQSPAGAAARPSWAQEQTVTAGFDARVFIEEGGHPLERVMEDLGKLPAGEVYGLTTPFQPEPLIDLAKRKGFEAFSLWESTDLVRTYFKRLQAPTRKAPRRTP